VDPEQLQAVAITVAATNVVAPGIQEVMKGVITSVKEKWRTIDEAVDYALWSAAAKLTEKDTPPEVIVAPSPEVLSPVATALVNTAMDETLQQMYVQLLATSMDSRTQGRAHPAYAEILRQMTSLEAKTLAVVNAMYQGPLKLFSAGDGDANWGDMSNDLGFYFLPKTIVPARAFENLFRLGLIDRVPQGHEPLPELTKRFERRPALRTALAFSLFRSQPPLVEDEAVFLTDRMLQIFGGQLHGMPIRVFALEMTGFGRDLLDAVGPIPIASFVREHELELELIQYPAGIHA
jgi:hypothetical protein